MVEPALSDQAAERLALLAPFAPLLYLLLILVPLCGVPVLFALVMNGLEWIARLIIRPEKQPVSARALLPTVAEIPPMTAAPPPPIYTPPKQPARSKKKKRPKPQLQQRNGPGRYIIGPIPPGRYHAHADECATSCCPDVRGAGVDCTDIYTARLQGATDEEHLAFAAVQRRVLLTFDRDFVSLATKRPHAGIIFVEGGPTKANQYEMLRLLLELFEEE